MFKFIAIVILAVVCHVSAKPAPQFVAYNAPLVASTAYAAPIATSAVVSREYHGVSAPLIASPYTAAYTAPYVAAPAYAYSAPLLI
ncbi:hypothetical protein Bhyg_06857 [Pseudolycoriella hygida]|uniref:Uncharacterized protein n=1 Tax=Pseudolycoriella hygida TaxID=35572 RepID=A0A9Q0N2Q4_9DIPT|nr:hypothetical protein Bhyg_06857 [Pseudolycoriella hygida]